MRYLDYFESGIISVIKEINKSKFIKESKKTLPYECYIRECKTIKLLLPRQFGSTSLLVRLTLKYNLVIYVYNRVNKEDMISKCDFIKERIFTEPKTIEGIDIVFIDCASCFKQERLDEIYEINKDNNPIYILMS